MDNGELSSLDFRFIANEMKAKLTGGTFRKIYQYGKKKLLFEIYSSVSGENFLYADNKRTFLASSREDAPDEPPNFCMFLRKHLMNRHVTDVRQHGFDRIIEVETEENIIIFEFVPPGNVVLCDKLYNIVMPLEVQKWKHRDVRAGESYLFPPSQHDIMKIEIWDFFTEISGSVDMTVSLALSGMGLGHTYATDCCIRSGIKPDRPAAKVTVDEATVLFNTIKTIINSPPEPCVYNDTVSAFPLESRRGPCKPAVSFSEALDAYFSAEIEKEESAERKGIEEKETARVGRIEKSRVEAKEVLVEKKEEKSTSAQLIYKHYDIVSNVLQGIQSARDAGMNWQQIKDRLSMSQSREAKAVKEIREAEGLIVIDLEGNDVVLNFRKTAEENAGFLFEGVKKIRKKIERIEKLPEPKTMSVEEIQQTITGKKLRQKAATRARKSKEPGAKGVKKRWYETYRWFVSSEGNTVIAGKNALQNDSVVKSRFKEGDLAFHADIHGAAFVVAKCDKEGKVGPLTVKEAVEFAAAHSKAWSSGYSEVDVNQFSPGSLSKTTPEGGKLPRGSFHVKKVDDVHEKVDVRLSIGVSISESAGVYQATVIAGPLMPVRKSCKYFATIQPGSIDGNELAQKVKNAILAKCMPEHRHTIESLPLEDFSRHIPGGQGSLVGG